jgi:hypothetical protein
MKIIVILSFMETMEAHYKIVKLHIIYLGMKEDM